MLKRPIVMLGALAVAAAPASRVAGSQARVSPTVAVSAARPGIPHVEPHLVSMPGEPPVLLVAAKTIDEDGAQPRVVTYRSEDGGLSWEDNSSGSLPAQGDDPWLATIDGAALLVQLPGEVRRSPSPGGSWRDPVTLPRGSGGSFDYPKTVIDDSGGPFDGRFYVVAAQAGADEPSSVTVLRSLDGGLGFEPPVRLRPSNIEHQVGVPAVAVDGTLVVPFHELTLGGELLDSPRLWVVRSTNGGEQFGLPSLVAEGFRADSPSSAVDHSGGRHHGRLYLGWMGLPDGWHHYVAHSDDSGSRWSRPSRVDDAGESEELFPPHHPELAVNDDGVLGATWFESHDDPSGECYALRFAASRDGGESFSPSVALTPPECSHTDANSLTVGSSDVPVWRRWRHGGDYHGMIARPDGAFQVVWADSRTGVFQLWSLRVAVS